MLNYNAEKKQMILNEIKNMYPSRMILNATQTVKILGISLRTFSRLIANEELNKLPKFKSEQVERKDGLKSNKYQFNIFDVAEFLSEN